MELLRLFPTDAAPRKHVIFMPKAIAESPHFVPRLARHQDRGQVTQLCDSLAVPLQTPLNGVVRFTILPKDRQIHTRRIAKNGFCVLNNIL